VWGLAAVTVASPLTHGRGLSLVVPALFVVAVVLWRFRPPARALAAYAGMWAVTIASGAALYLATRAPGAEAYGGEIGQQTDQGFNLRQFLSYVWQFYLPKLAVMSEMIGPPHGYRQVYIETFYGTFGALDVRWRPWTDDLLQVLSALGLVALYTAAITRWRQVTHAWDVVALLALMFISLLALLHLASYRDLLQNGGSDPLFTGRYLLPLIPLWGLAIAYVLSRLPRAAGPICAAVLVALGVLLQLAGIGLTGARFYG
jgi:hypothetical protein